MAHFKNVDGSETHLVSYPQTEQQISDAATWAGLKIKDRMTIKGNDTLVEINDRWSKHLNSPMIQIWTLEKG